MSNVSKKLKIGDVMTQAPHTITFDQNLKFATEKMQELGVRHLPVLRAGQLVGILSERDIRFLESFDKMDPKELTVEDACTEGPYTANVDASLSEVCATMADRKIGSALVLDGGKLVGIFTWVDALKVVARSL